MTFETYLKYREDFIEQHDAIQVMLIKKYPFHQQPYVFFKDIAKCRDFERFIYLFSNDIRKCRYRNVVSSLSDKKYKIGKPNRTPKYTTGDGIFIESKDSFYDKYPETFQQVQDYYDKEIKKL